MKDQLSCILINPHFLLLTTIILLLLGNDLESSQLISQRRPGSFRLKPELEPSGKQATRATTCDYNLIIY